MQVVLHGQLIRHGRTEEPNIFLLIEPTKAILILNLHKR